MASIINTGPGLKDAGSQLYLDTLKGYQDREAMYQGNYGNTIAGYERLHAAQQQYGDFDRMQAQKQYQQNFANIQAGLNARGLNNTTEWGIGSRGAMSDYQMTAAQIRDAQLNRQNQIAQNELGYMGQYQQGLAGIQGERLGWMGNVQGQTQAQNFQGMQQDEAYGQQAKQAAQNFQYQQAGAAQNFNYQRDAAQQDFNNRVNYQNMFGYYAGGGAVQPTPPPSGTDTVAARLTPGEFVLSNDMIKALETGRLNTSGLVAMIRQERANPAPAPAGYSHGGFVPRTMPSEYLMRQAMEQGRMPMGGGYVPRGRYG